VVLRQQQSLDSRQALVRVVVSLFDQGQFLSLRLIKTTLDTVCLLELFQCQYEQLGVVLV
jgi:hypothetical protein